MYMAILTASSHHGNSLYMQELKLDGFQVNAYLSIVDALKDLT